MPLKNIVSLHEAIVIALINKPNRSATFEEIEQFILKRSLIVNRKGGLSLTKQIMLRATKSRGRYYHLFEPIDEHSIRLRNV